MSTVIHNEGVARQSAAAIRNASNGAAAAEVRSCPAGVNLAGIGEAVSAHKGYGAVMAGRAGLVADVTNIIDTVASQLSALDRTQATALKN